MTVNSTSTTAAADLLLRLHAADARLAGQLASWPRCAQRWSLAPPRSCWLSWSTTTRARGRSASGAPWTGSVVWLHGVSHGAGIPMGQMLQMSPEDIMAAGQAIERALAAYSIDAAFAASAGS